MGTGSGRPMQNQGSFAAWPVPVPIFHTARRRTAVARHTCPHVKQIRPVTPSSEGCEEYLAAGEQWVHLRLCLTCGHVGCCDSSKNKHATKHFHASGHPVMKSAEPGEDWGWCYLDQIQLDSPLR